MKMKERIAYGVLGLSVVLLCYMGVKIWKNISYERMVAQRIKKLPVMEVYSLKQGTKENISRFLSAKMLVMVYFNTDCHFCQGEIKSLEKHSELLKSANFLFISSQPSKKIRTFYQDYHLSEYSSWNIMQDSLHFFKKIFGTNVYPNTYIYSSNGLLLKHFKGETSARAISRVLKNKAINSSQ